MPVLTRSQTKMQEHTFVELPPTKRVHKLTKSIEDFIVEIDLKYKFPHTFWRVQGEILNDMTTSDCPIKRIIMLSRLYKCIVDGLLFHTHTISIETLCNYLFTFYHRSKFLDKQIYSVLNDNKNGKNGKNVKRIAHTALVNSCKLREHFEALSVVYKWKDVNLDVTKLYTIDGFHN